MSHDTPLSWTLESLDLSQIDRARVRHNEDLFFLLCSSSFVECGSPLRTQRLINHFDGDIELQSWLSQHWEHDEQQHGRALAAYIQAVWPEFNWDKGFRAFCLEYDAACACEPLESSRGLELAARCVVATGTTSLYRALNEITDEPVLKRLTSHIRNDEAGHFKHFFEHYRRYQQREGFGRHRVFRAILRRLDTIRSEQGDVALRQVFNQCYPQHLGDKREFHRIRNHAHDLLRPHLPAAMTAKMLLKPMELPARLQSLLEKPLARITGKLVLR